MTDWREDYEPEPRTWWCLECGKECELEDDSDERGPAAETHCCGSRNYADTAPWCWHCENTTVAQDQVDAEGHRMCLACAWAPGDAS